MVTDAGGQADHASPRVPEADELLAIDVDGWAQVLVHARQALNDLEDDQLDPRLKRLRASPTSRLASGRVRAELAGAIAEGGPLWAGLHERLVTAQLPDRLSWLAEGEPAPEGRAQPPESEPGAEAQAEAADLRDRLERTRERSRSLQEERDEAIRRADGAKARADTLEDKLEQARQRAFRHEQRISDLEDELEEAREARQQAVERERRRHQRRIEELEDELTDWRRREQERTRREQAEQRRRERSARGPDRAADGDGQVGPGARAMPGRPTRLPEGVERETTEGAAALLSSGRRVLIDGYNVSRTHRSALELEQQRGWIVRLAQRASTRFGVQPHVVFDGAVGVGDYPGIHRGVDVSFSAEGVSADDEIAFLVEAAEPDEPLLVVTDDRELRSRVTERDVDVLGTGPFVWAVD